MSKYAEGKIYKIISDQTDMIYVGSTSEKYLSSRLNRHRSNYKGYLVGKYNYVTSFEILKYDDAKIILLELYPCQCREQLLAKEQSYIDIFKSKTVNIQNAFGKDLEGNIVKRKQYYERNKDVIAEKMKQYREAHKDILAEKHKQYHEANKDVINAQRRMKHICACGDITTSRNKARHERTTRHQMLMQLKDNPTAENI